MIYAFYSYKGGVGRTLSLVHVGIRLASTRREKGYKILLVDMDLEAPGLDVYVPPTEGESSLGFAGLLKGYRENGRQLQWLEDNLNTDRFIRLVPGAENLWVMPSGIKAQLAAEDGTAHSYLDVVAALKDEMPVTTVPVHPEEGFFHDLAQVLKRQFTYVFIDSRSGLADQSYASTLLLADALVLCFRLNRANIEGIQTVLGNFLLREQKCLGTPDLSIIPVATPVPARGGADIEHWLAVAGEAFLGKAEAEEGTPGREGAQGSKEEPLFPPVERIFYEPSLEIGEKLILNFDGTLKEGFSEQTPIVTSLYGLADRVSALNADIDAAAAKWIELRYYRDRRNYEKALEYLLKRIRLEPLDMQHWKDLLDGYTGRRETHQSAKKHLGTLIAGWRREINPSDPCRDPVKAKRLAWALHTWATCFGKDQPDAGLSSVAESLSLCCDDEGLAENSHLVFGQIVEELVRKRKSAELVHDERVPSALCLELADEHYAKAIDLGLRKKHKGGPALLYRARNLRHLERHYEALASYDTYLLEIAPKQGEKLEQHHVVVLYEQGQTLEYLGWYNWAFRNHRAALAKEPLDTDALRELSGLAFDLELIEYWQQISRLWEREAPRDPAPHWVRAYQFALVGEFDAALEETRLARLYLTDPRLGLFYAEVHLLCGQPEIACDIMPGVLEAQTDERNSAIYALALAWCEKEGARGFVSEKAEKTWALHTIAALALPDPKLAKNILDRVKYEKSSMRDRAFYHAVSAACSALRSDDVAPPLQAIRELFDRHALLPVCLRDDLEMRLFRMTWDRLRTKGRLPEQSAASLKPLWTWVDEPRGPTLEDLPPRNLSEPLPPAILGAERPCRADTTET